RMSVPSDGLLSTDVTWDEVERLLTQSLKTEAKFGANKSVTQLGQGFMSRIGLIMCDWEGAKHRERLPERIALKMTTFGASKAMAEKVGDKFSSTEKGEDEAQKKIREGWANFVIETHNTEVDVYRFLTRLDADLTVPVCYYSAPFTKENVLAGSLALEYSTNSRVIPFHETMSVDQVKQIARALGKIQAASVRGGVDKELSLTRDSWTKFWSQLPPVMFRQFMEKTKELDKSLVECVDAALLLLPEYFGSNLPMTIHKQMNCGRVLVNGDHWSANVLFDATTGDLRSIIDWQISHAGVGVEDLLRISMSGLNSIDRRSHMPDILNEMYDSMKTHLEGATEPYSRELMSDLYDLLLPHAAFFFAPILTPLFASAIDGGNSAEDKKMRKEVIVDKVRGIYEDIAIYHETNQKKGLNLKWKAS
ncbi:hypothetical protein PFISCL1PPCAC_18656, partial [Pristionchus fissidentatus]